MLLRLLPFVIVSMAVMSISAAPVKRTNSNDVFACLADNSSLNLVTPSSDRQQFASLTGAFNQRLTTSAAAVVTPTDVDGVSAAINCARANNIPVTAKGGGHSYAAYGVGNGLDQGLVIYLSEFQNIELQPDNETVIIGGGARLGDIALQLNEWGRGMAHGVCPFVGVGGHAAFGGFGYASRAWGLTLDSIIAFDVVLANGTVVAGLTREQDPDLFWALAGAGPNYGVVTAYHFMTHPIPENVVSFDYSYSGLSPETMTQAFLAYQTWGQESSPPELGITVVVGTGGSFDIHGIYFGSGEDFTDLMAPFLQSLPSGVSVTVNDSMSWIDSLQSLAGSQALSTQGQTDNRDSFYAKSLMTPDSDQLITSDAATAFFTYLQNTDTDTNWFVEVNLYGGNGSSINAVSLDQSSFAHRSSLLTFQMYASSSTYGNPYPDSGFSFVSGMYDALVEPMKESWGSSYGAYVNYVDPALNHSEVQNLYWGTQYERLSQLRARYDPQQVFFNPQAIRPSNSTS